MVSLGNVLLLPDNAENEKLPLMMMASESRPTRNTIMNSN